MDLIHALEALTIDEPVEDPTEEIEDFIHRRFPSDENNWTQGNCWYFAKILETRFPGGKIMYEPIDGHFLYLYKGKYYDWNGLYTGDLSHVYDHHIEEGSGFYKELMRATFEQSMT